MRPLAALSCLLAVAAALTACGKGHRPATRTVTVQAGMPPAGGGSGGATKGQTSRARALAFAEAVNLRPEDVPGFQSSVKEKKQPSTPAERHLNLQLQRCIAGGVSGRAVAEVSSTNFQRKASLAEQGVSSSVTVARSSAIAQRELKAIRSPRARSCFTRYLTLLFKGAEGQGATVGPVSVAAGTPPAPGTTGSFGLRVSTELIVRSVRIPFDLDILGFVTGPAEVVLSSTGVPVPFPAAAEQQLFLLLLARAKAHPLH